MYNWYKDSYEEEEQLLKEIERYEKLFGGNIEDYEDYDACNEWCEI